MFDRIIIIDWSAADRPTPVRPSANALWVGMHGRQGAMAPRYFRTRRALIQWLIEELLAAVSTGERILLGFDFVYGYPSGLATALGLEKGPAWRAIWKYWSDLISDTEKNANNRFAAAQTLNRRLSGDCYPFWACPAGKAGMYLSTHKEHSFPVTIDSVVLTERRLVERRHKPLQPAWKLAYPASVGSQALTGIPYLHQLRFEVPGLKGQSLVWPFETGFQLPNGEEPLIVHAEIWPGIVPLPDGPQVKDARQVAALSAHLWQLNVQEGLAAYFEAPKGLSAADRTTVLLEEGWVLGIQ